MKTLDAYLDSLFSPYPATPQFTAARGDLREMMVDKYEALLQDGAPEHLAAARVIAEFGDLEELAPVLDTSDLQQVNTGTDTITASDVSTYLNVRRAQGRKQAVAIALLLSSLSLIPLGISVFGLSSLYPATIYILLLVTLALVLWGLGVLIALKREAKPFRTKVQQGYRPRAEAQDLTAKALAESRKQRYSYTALGSLILAIGLTAYIFSLVLAINDLEPSYILTGAAVLLLTAGIGCGLIAYGDTERDLQRKLATAERRYFLPQNSPYTAIRVATYLLLPLTALTSVLSAVLTHSFRVFWLYLAAALLLYWTLYLTNKALIGKTA